MPNAFAGPFASIDTLLVCASLAVALLRLVDRLFVTKTGPILSGGLQKQLVSTAFLGFTIYLINADRRPPS